MKQQLLNIKTWLKITPYILLITGAILLMSKGMRIKTWWDVPQHIESTAENLHTIEPSHLATPVTVTDGVLHWAAMVYSYTKNNYSKHGISDIEVIDSAVVPYFNKQDLADYINNGALPHNFQPIYVSMTWDQVKELNPRIVKLAEKKITLKELQRGDLLLKTDLTFSHDHSSKYAVNSEMKKELADSLGTTQEPFIIRYGSEVLPELKEYKFNTLAIVLTSTGFLWLLVLRSIRAKANRISKQKAVATQNKNKFKHLSATDITKLISDSKAFKVISILWLIASVVNVGLFFYAVDSYNDELAFLSLGSFVILLPASIGLMKRTSWGRKMGFISAILLIPGIPIGTILGIFLLIALTRSGELFGFERFTVDELKLELAKR